MRFCGIHLRTISQRWSMLPFGKISSKIILLKLLPDLTGSSELIYSARCINKTTDLIIYSTGHESSWHWHGHTLISLLINNRGRSDSWPNTTKITTSMDKIDLYVIKRSITWVYRCITVTPWHLHNSRFTGSFSGESTGYGLFPNTKGQ